ncbi:MAG: homoserine O-acetyltransferase [Vicinamibacterales bacterium]
MTSSPATGSVGPVAPRHVELSEPLPLECGRTLTQARLTYETYGTLAPDRGNAILVCHALSGDAHAAGTSVDPSTPSALDGFGAESRGVTATSGLGWWDGMIGPGKAFDTTRYFVICSNVLGGCRGSTGPSSLDPATGRPYGPDFPVVTVGDMVEAQARLLDHLEIPALLSISGGSLGGMQALEWAVRFPHRVRSIVPIASTARLDSQGVAWNAIAREAIRADPDWQGGRYHGTGRAPTAGIGVARMVGHVTYLSAESMRAKFGRALNRRSSYSYDLGEADFAEESYLRHQAARFAARFDANTYLHLSRALTYFDLARAHGGGRLDLALRRARAACLFISFTSDWLYPPRDSAALVEAARAAGLEAEWHNIDAPYGHDSFLLEEARITPIVRDFLARRAHETTP